MTGGAHRHWQPEQEQDAETQTALPLGDDDMLAVAEDEIERPRRWKDIALAAAMALLAVAWIGIVGILVAGTSPASGIGMARAVAWIGVGCGPLTLIAVLALILFRTGRAEATRYARVARDLRHESLRLAELLTLVDRRILSARQGLAKHGAELVRIGEETSGRLGRAGEGLRDDAALIADTAAKLDDATATARTDLGVLLTDLPGLEARATGLSEQLRAIGHDAEAHGAVLAEALAGIEAQARAADQGSVAAARRLAIELERIEGSAAAADRRVAEAAARLAEAADVALEGAAGALDHVRRGIGDQGAALTALVTQAREQLSRSGDEAQRALAFRLDQLIARVEETSNQIVQHEAGARALLNQLDQALGSVERRFEGLGDSGAEHVANLAETLAALAEHGEQIGRLMGQNGQITETMLGRITALRTQVHEAGDMLHHGLPDLLVRVGEQADEALARLRATTPQAEVLVAMVEGLQEKLAENGALIEIGTERVARAADAADARVRALRGEIESLEGLVARTDGEIAALSEGASVRLVDALLRVRETAAQAAAQARDSLSTAIPEAAAALGKASAEAMAGALKGIGEDEIASVRAVSEEAADAATAATERLTRQLMTLTETTRQVEARIAEHQAASAADDEQSFARQVGLLIEALNSTAIDVAKILSNEPTDAEWAAYLKGERGVFTRRAVRLLDGGDARALASRYSDDSEFRAQVNRYIHDFEAMLRRVLAVREGASMAVTMLSSDMGKLYVALAQAIERLRR